jgi:SAM-dependent methyltransferase
MLRYVLMSAAAKGFSVSPATRRAYRHVGNRVETARRVRAGLPDRYVERAGALLAQLAALPEPIRSSARVLELGTGWVHWESVIVRLALDVEPTMFDVVDCRLWTVHKRYVRDLITQLGSLPLADGRRDTATRLLERLGTASSFDEAYEVLNATYVLNPSGSVNLFDAETFNLVVSADVLEHVDRDVVPQVIADTYRVLEPGGFAIHQIDLVDHLAYFDPGVSPKFYYRFSGRVWDRCFNSRVQYINRVQRPHWERLFAEAGFEVVADYSQLAGLGDLRVHGSYRYLDRSELETATLRLVLRKPSSA